MITKECLFCENNLPVDTHLKELYPQTFTEEKLNADIFSARRTTEHFHYKMVRCNNTGLVFSREILNDEKLKELYKDSKVTFSEHETLIANDYWMPLNSISKGWEKNKALDIGCSNGFFLDKLLRQGYKNVYGCEPSTEAKEKANPQFRENIHTGFFEKDLYPENTFDLITIFQTLDHLTEPLQMMEAIYKALKPGGRCFVIVHNVDSLQARIFKDKSPIIDVEHIYLFNKKTLDLLGKKVGFKTEAIVDIKNTYPLSYWLRMAPIPFKSFFQKATKFIGMSEMKIPIKPGNIGGIFVK